MTRLHVLAIFLLLSLTALGQEDVCIGKKYTLHSSALDETRSYMVALPVDYATDTTAHYPVIYLLDGETLFVGVAGMMQAFSSNRAKMPARCIIVGVVSTDRTRDFTPTASRLGRDGKEDMRVAPGGGQSETFSRFLVSELRQAVDSAYRTNGSNILIGHSYAGLFAVNTFLRHTHRFDSYIAIDPSLWWDGGKLVAEASQLIEDKDFSGKNLYLCVASRRRTDRQDVHLQKALHLMNNVLPKAANLHLFSKSFPDEHHGTIALPGIYDGIKTIFRK